MFASGVLTAAAMKAGDEVLAVDAGELGPLEWRVVALARSEADRFGRAATIERGPLARLLARCTGLRGGVARLADERLEALRRFVCLVRRADRGTTAAATALIAFGFSTAAVHAVAAAAMR